MMNEKVTIYEITEDSTDKNSISCSWKNNVISVILSLQFLTVVFVVLLLHVKHIGKIYVTCGYFNLPNYLSFLLEVTDTIL